jgi:DNA-binding MarR family transcriptional regulator
VNKPPPDDDGRTLHLLELIHRDGMLTQRELARKLNIALGLVNLSLKRLMHQEMIKVKRLSARRFCYLLTPQGMSEKGRLSARYLADSFSMYRSARRACLRTLVPLRDRGLKRLVLYGTGELAEAAFITIHDLGLTLVAVADGAGAPPFLGREVVPLKALDPAAADRVLFAGPEADRAAFAEAAAAAGFAPEAIEDLAAALLEADAALAGVPAEEQPS